jgi:hypothetical protein
MSKNFLDLKKFKHVKSDDKSTTLQHKDGHVLTVAHKALSKDFQKQLSALSQISKDAKTPDQAQEEQQSQVKMADGGDVGYLGSRNMPKNADPHAIAPGSDKDFHDKTTPEQDKQRHQEADDADARGKAAGLYADGGDVSADPNQVMTPNPNYQPQFEGMSQDAAPAGAPANPYAEMYNKIYSQDMKLNPGQPDDFARTHALNVVESQRNADQSNAKIAVEDAQAQQTKVMQENMRRQAIGLEPIPVPSVPQLPGANQAVQMPQATATMQPVEQAKQGVEDAQHGLASGLPGMASSHDPESMLQAGFQQRMAGIQQQAAATGQLGEQQAQVLDRNLQDQHIAQQSFQQSYRQLEDERQAHMQDIKDGYIDPNAYWKDHSKVMSGIGMILAGFNPTNSPNAAVNFLKFQMEQSLEAQRQNLGAKQNLLAANQRQFGNLRDAMDMTRVMQNDIMAHELQSAAAKAQTPMAKAAALQAAGQLQMEAAPLFQQFALRRAMMNLTNNGGSPNAIEHMLGYMRVVNPEMAKEMESRYVPGVGLAATPVPNDVRGQLISKQQFGEAVKNLQSWATQHSGSLSPSAIAEGRTMAANVQNLYRQGINGGVFKQGEQSFISGIIDAEPTKFFNSIRVIPKLNEALRENQASLNILKKGYGLPAQQEAQAPQIKIVNGVKYMRGPNGQAIRVK